MNFDAILRLVSTKNGGGNVPMMGVRELEKKKV